MRYVRRKIAIREERSRRSRARKILALAPVVRLYELRRGRLNKWLRPSGWLEFRIEKEARCERMNQQYRAWMSCKRANWPPSELWSAENYGFSKRPQPRREGRAPFVAHGARQ